LTRLISVSKNLDAFGGLDQIGEAPFKTGCSHQMIINPMIIPAPGLVHEQAVVFEAPAD
jgi:hypothetical protein